MVKRYCTDETLLDTAVFFRYIVDAWSMICDWARGKKNLLKLLLLELLNWCNCSSPSDLSFFGRGGHVLFFSLDPVLDVNYIVSEVLK